MIIHDIMVPAQIGMKSFVTECETLRKAMARLCPDGFTEFPPCRRIYQTAAGHPAEHVVFVFRAGAPAHVWEQIQEVLKAQFGGKAPYMVASLALATGLPTPPVKNPQAKE